MAKQSLLQKFSRLSEAKKLLLFLLVFATIGGGYMAYKSFAATPLLSTPCYTIQSYGSLEKNTQQVGSENDWQRCQSENGEIFRGNKPTHSYLQVSVQGKRPSAINMYCSGLDCTTLDGLKLAYAKYFAALDKSYSKDNVYGTRQTSTNSPKDIYLGGKKAILFERVTNNLTTGNVDGYNNHIIVDTGFYPIPSSNFNCNAVDEYDKANNCKLQGFLDVGISTKSSNKTEMDDFYNIVSASWKWNEPAIPDCLLDGKGPVRVNGTQILSQATFTCNAKYANAVVTGSIFQWDNKTKSTLKNNTANNKLDTLINLVLLDDLKPKCRDYSVEYTAYLTDNDGQTKVGKTYTFKAPSDSRNRNICNTR